MSRRQRKNKNVMNYYLIVIFIIFLITVATGYSILSENIKIQGKSNINYSTQVEGLDVVVTLINSWGSSPEVFYRYKIELVNHTEEDLDGWKITVEVPDDTIIAENADNANTELTDGILTFTNKEYNQVVTAGTSIQFEFQIKTSVANLNIDSAVLNDSSSGNTQIPVSGIEINPTTLILYVDEKAKISATIMPQNAIGTIIWTSENEEVATVDNKGNVTGISEGTTVVTATIKGFSQQCNVEILSKIMQNIIDITFEKGNSWQIGEIYYSQYNIKLSNISNSVINGWRFDVQLPEGTTINSYNAPVIQNEDNSFTFENAEYNGTIPVGGSQTIQIQINSTVAEYDIEAINIHVD